MYRLTPRMLQRLRAALAQYHSQFSGGRCSGWQLEELIVVAIQSDTGAQHHVAWREAGHDDKSDIEVSVGDIVHMLQIKSGQLRKSMLVLSGHRLGRYKGALEEITAYLNSPHADIMAVEYRKEDDDQGRRHMYRVCYVDKKYLTGLDSTKWTRKGAQYIQKNSFGVDFSLRPSMSWQIWWSIPESLLDSPGEFTIE